MHTKGLCSREKESFGVQWLLTCQSFHGTGSCRVCLVWRVSLCVGKRFGQDLWERGEEDKSASLL